jgi:hypothetical protein
MSGLISCTSAVFASALRVVSKMVTNRIRRSILPVRSKLSSSVKMLFTRLSQLPADHAAAAAQARTKSRIMRGSMWPVTRTVYVAGARTVPFGRAYGHHSQNHPCTRSPCRHHDPRCTSAALAVLPKMKNR